LLSHSGLGASRRAFLGRRRSRRLPVTRSIHGCTHRLRLLPAPSLGGRGSELRRNGRIVPPEAPKDEGLCSRSPPLAANRPAPTRRGRPPAASPHRLERPQT